MRRFLAAVSLVGVFALSPALALDPATIEAAKKEGEVVWYTTQIINPFVLDMEKAFTARTGVKVKYVRANSTDIALRIATEGQAGRMQSDVFDGTTSAEFLKKGGYVLQWLPDEAKSFAPEYVDPEGYWVASNFYIITAAFNTSLIAPGTEPKSWDALLDPKLKGKIAWGATPSISAGAGFIGIALKEMGQEKGMTYLRKLAGQDIAGIKGSARVTIDRAIAGEYAVALQIFPEHAVGGEKQGAPIRWIAMQPAMTGIVSTTAITKGSPHPNAAKLLLEFLISEEGQKVYRDNFYIPANPKVPPLDPEITPAKHRTVFLTPREAEDNMGKWMDVYQELFR